MPYLDGRHYAITATGEAGTNRIYTFELLGDGDSGDIRVWEYETGRGTYTITDGKIRIEMERMVPPEATGSTTASLPSVSEQGEAPRNGTSSRPMRKCVSPDHSPRWVCSVVTSVPTEEDVMKLSACNQIRGKVTAIKEGAVEAQVSIDVRGQTIVSVVTLDAVTSLGLKVGSDVIAVVKADSVLLAVD